MGLLNIDNYGLENKRAVDRIRLNVIITVYIFYDGKKLQIACYTYLC